MERIQIINSKLIPPIPSATYMRRSSFIKQMNIAIRHRLTILHSGPGFGKSMGLAQYFKDSKEIYSWYTVTAEDDDIIPFMSYLRESIRRIIPFFGQSLTNVTAPSAFLKEDDLQQWLALFINELCDIKKNLTIIIDDFHLVDHVFQINFLMEKVIELLPPNVRIIIASRALPKWSNLLRLQLKDQYYEMTKEALIFSKEEITVYLEDYFNIEIADNKAEEIVAITEGWAIAINLMAMQLTETELSFSNILKPVFQNLFDYLSEEVFQRRTKKEQAWLMDFAIFPTFSAELIEDFYGKEAVAGLRKLSLEHGFIQTLGEEDSYRYHALYERFLKNKWLQTDPETFSSLHKKATTYYYEKNNFLQATYHASETNDPEFIAKTLTATAIPLIRSGQFDWFLEISSKLDERVKDEHYELFYFEGEVQRYRAYYEQARQAYVTCLAHAEQHQDTYFLSRSNAGLAHIFLDTIQPALAESYLKKAIMWSQHTERMKKSEKAMLKRQFAENLVNLGRAEDALKWVKKEALSSSILREGNLDARIFLRMGKLRGAKTILKEHIAKRTSLPDSHRETEILLSLIYGMIGDVDSALKTAHKGIEIGKEVKSDFIQAVGYTRAGHAETLANPYMLENSLKYYEQAINMIDELNVSRVKAEPLMGLALLKARQGKFQEAIRNGEDALRETEKVNDDWLSGLIRVSLAMIYFYHKDLKQSVSHIQEAKKLFSAGGDRYGEMVCLFWLANIYFHNEKLERFLHAITYFSKICIEDNYLFFLTKDTIFGSFDRQVIYPIFKMALDQRPNEPCIRLIADEIKINEHINHPGYRIFTSTFGRLQVLLGQYVIDENKWQREKAKELLLYFLLNKNRYIRKEEIKQSLWENIDEKTADRNFKVTMNALLKVIEPNRKAREQPYFIMRKNTMYYLNQKADITSDHELFLTYANKGLEETDRNSAIEYLLKASSLYKGTPFEEFRNADWIIRKREELEKRYIHVLEKLARHYLQEREYYQVIKWAEEIVKIDCTWEEAYRLLMHAYFKLENRAQSIKWYEKCVQVLQKELNIGPMDSTNELFQMITESE